MNKSIKAIVALMIVAIVLTIVSMAQTSQPLSVDDGSFLTVTEGKAVWAQAYGGSADDRALYALPVGDGFLVVGSTRSVVNATVGWALMLDSQGNQLWNHTYLDGAGTEIRCAANTSDGYLLVGNQFAASGDINGYVAKVDLAGALVWQTIVGGAKTDKLFSGVAANDGFVVCGLSYSYGGDAAESWAVKLDSQGVVVWNNVYGGYADAALRSAVVASDGGFVAAGYVDEGEGNYDFYLLKLANDGSRIWNCTYGGFDSEKAYSITTAQNGYVVVGDAASTATNTDAWVLKVDPQGVQVWSKTVGGNNADSAAYITAAKSGGYLVCGFTFSFGEGQRDFWLFSISEEGQVGFSCTYGNSAFQEAYAVIDAGTDQYVLVGWTDPLGQPELVGRATYDFYAVKLGKGEVTSSFSTVTIVLTLVIFALLAVILVLLFRMRGNKK